MGMCEFLLAVLAVAPADCEPLMLTPDTITSHGYHLRCEPVGKADTADYGRERSNAPVTVHLRFGRLPGGSAEDLTPIKAVSLVLFDDDGEVLRIPLTTTVDPGNRVHLYARFLAKKELLPKMRLEFDEDRPQGPQPYIADLKAFIGK
jgi:hypothetical protein